MADRVCGTCSRTWPRCSTTARRHFGLDRTALLGHSWEENLASRLDGQEPPEEEREQVVLQWSADFADRERALERARRMADPWFEINYACNSALNTETERAWGTPELRAACRDLDVPVLIVDGAEDIRPRSAVDSLAEALPRVRRTVLPGTGHVPWAEAPDAFREAVAGALPTRPQGPTLPQGPRRRP
ncbi:alpha/beta fold hydrolase [Streptomyces griseorubiginosus]|uniref:alpha/beta fold hydrolase n=1 Tax=Streptomyces griseorubiginosus TaxID=67304 RepID=UPI003406F056